MTAVVLIHIKFSGSNRQNIESYSIRSFVTFLLSFREQSEFVNRQCNLVEFCDFREIPLRMPVWVHFMLIIEWRQLLKIINRNKIFHIVSR